MELLRGLGVSRHGIKAFNRKSTKMSTFLAEHVATRVDFGTHGKSELAPKSYASLPPWTRLRLNVVGRNLFWSLPPWTAQGKRHNSSTKRFLPKLVLSLPLWTRLRLNVLSRNLFCRSHPGLIFD